MKKPKIRNDLKSSSRGKRNRRAGQNYERKLAKEFREVLGYERCTTSRYSSTLLDSCKVDLDVVDINVQAKNYKRGFNYTQLLVDIAEALEKHFPERLRFITAIFHKKMGQEVVILSKEDFYLLFSAYKQNLYDTQSSEGDVSLQNKQESSQNSNKPTSNEDE